MLRVREKQLIPKKEFVVKWGAVEFKGMSFQEQFEVEDYIARPVAVTVDGTPIVYENKYKKGSVMILGSFAGQENYEHLVAMYPLGGILARWAGFSELKLWASALLE